MYCLTPLQGLQNKLMQLRKICNHPYLFDEKAGFDIDEKLVRSSGALITCARMYRLCVVD